MPDKFEVGDYREIRRSFSSGDVQSFANLSGDMNPIHLDMDYARTTPFGQPIVHGILAASLFSALIANDIPGTGSIYLHQDLDFKSPVFFDTEVIARVTVVSRRDDKPIYELRTTCMDVNGKILIDGKALVLKRVG